MDLEFSDFQSAPVFPSTNQINKVVPEPGSHFRNLNSHGMHKSTVLPLVSQASTKAPGVIKEDMHKQRAVGCRLANYDLGIPTASPRINKQFQQPQLTNFGPSCTPMQPQQLRNDDNLLMGEEDKYSALRGILDNTSFNNVEASTPSTFESQTAVSEERNYVSHRISLVSDDVLEIVKTESSDKPIDFGEFQSFKSATCDNEILYSSNPTSSALGKRNSRNDLLDQNLLFNTDSTVVTNTVSVPRQNLPSNENLNLSASTFNTHSSSLSDGEFGDFVSFYNSDVNTTKSPIFESPKISLKSISSNKKSSSDFSGTKCKKSLHGTTKVSMSRIEKASNILTDSPTPTYPKIADVNQVSTLHPSIFDIDFISSPPEVSSFVSATVPNDDLDLDLCVQYSKTTGEISTSEFGAPLKTTIIGSSSDNIDDFGEFASAHQVSDFQSAMVSKANSLDLLPFCKPIKANCAGETQSLSSLDLGSFLESGDEKESVVNKASPDSSRILEFSLYDKEEVIDAKSSSIMQSGLVSHSCFQVGHHETEISPVSDSSNQEDDKYKCFKDEIEIERVSEWCRCLGSCLNIISFAQSILNSASSSEVVREIVSSEKGKEYIQNVVEVYLVASRISRSCRKLGGWQKVQRLFDEITAVWDLLSPFLLGTSVMENTLNDWEEQDYSDCFKACGLCLFNSEDGNPESLLQYRDNNYHPTCANLWINTVDSVLPSL